MSQKSDPPRRRRLAAPEARERILEAAQKRLAEGGPEAVRLQDVAADLGISHPAILHHFGSRDGLMTALENRAMQALQRDLLAASGSAADSLDRVARTLGDEGHARLLAWWVLGSGAPVEGSEWSMLAELADGIHARRVATAEEAGEPAPSHEDTVFVVRLAASALFGEALLGELLTESAGLEDNAEVSRRFRLWLADLLQG